MLIALDVIQLKEDGKSLKQIRTDIDAKYSAKFPNYTPTPTPMPE